MLNREDIRKKKGIFFFRNDYIGYYYYFDPGESLTIYVEYSNALLKLHSLECYRLKEDRNIKKILLLMKYSRTNGGFVRNAASIAGFNKEDALKYLIEKIINPIRDHDIGANIEDFESRLKELLKFPQEEKV